jgi:hypothetical protein
LDRTRGDDVDGVRSDEGQQEPEASREVPEEEGAGGVKRPLAEEITLDDEDERILREIWDEDDEDEEEGDSE